MLMTIPLYSAQLKLRWPKPGPYLSVAAAAASLPDAEVSQDEGLGEGD